MHSIVPIVEGHGEVKALPILLRRINDYLAPGTYFDVAPPIRIPKDRLLNNDEEKEKTLRLAANKLNEEGWLLVLLDSDDHCPKQLAESFGDEIRQIVPEHLSSCILAKREYEAWFLAAADSLDGVRGFDSSQVNVSPEAVRDAKGIINQCMEGRAYGEVNDQPALSAKMDIEEASTRSRSFQKLLKEYKGWLGVAI